MLRSKVLTLVIFCCLVTLFTGCPDPSMSLRVEPESLCQGDYVSVEWSHEYMHSVKLNGGSEGTQDISDQENGIQSFQVEGDITISVSGISKNGDSFKREKKVTIWPAGGMTKSMAFGYKCPDSGWSPITFGVNQYSKSIKVQGVDSPNTREVRVSHAGESEVIPPNGSTNKFNGTPLTGIWAINANLKENESSYESCVEKGYSGTTGPGTSMPMVRKDPPDLKLSVFCTCE